MSAESHDEMESGQRGSPKIWVCSMPGCGAYTAFRRGGKVRNAQSHARHMWDKHNVYVKTEDILAVVERLCR